MRTVALFGEEVDQETKGPCNIYCVTGPVQRNLLEAKKVKAYTIKSLKNTGPCLKKSQLSLMCTEGTQYNDHRYYLIQLGFQGAKPQKLQESSILHH